VLECLLLLFFFFFCFSFSFLLYVLWCMSSFLCVGEELEGSVVMVECGKLEVLGMMTAVSI
jgi:hypothetical protein